MIGLVKLRLVMVGKVTFITLRYVHDTLQHVKAFPISPQTSHFLSIAIMSLHVTPPSLFTPSKLTSTKI